MEAQNVDLIGFVVEETRNFGILLGEPASKHYQTEALAAASGTLR